MRFCPRRHAFLGSRGPTTGRNRSFGPAEDISTRADISALDPGPTGIYAHAREISILVSAGIKSI